MKVRIRKIKKMKALSRGRHPRLMRLATHGKQYNRVESKEAVRFSCLNANGHRAYNFVYILVNNSLYLTQTAEKVRQYDACALRLAWQFKIE